MNERTLEILPINDLWALREKLNGVLAAKIIAEKQELDRRLGRLRRATKQKCKRRYPRVLPKYPEPGETMTKLGQAVDCNRVG